MFKQAVLHYGSTRTYTKHCILIDNDIEL